MQSIEIQKTTFATDNSEATTRCSTKNYVLKNCAIPA